VGLGGLLTSTRSCILLAELAVGRIMRARKDSSGPREPALLTRDRGLSWVVVVCEVGARVACDARLRIVVLPGVVGLSPAPELLAGGALRVFVLPLAPVRLSGRVPVALFNFAADAAV
jgi:hypothetical protein